MVINNKKYMAMQLKELKVKSLDSRATLFRILYNT